MPWGGEIDPSRILGAGVLSETLKSPGATAQCSGSKRPTEVEGHKSPVTLGTRGTLSHLDCHSHSQLFRLKTSVVETLGAQPNVYSLLPPYRGGTENTWGSNVPSERTTCPSLPPAIGSHRTKFWTVRYRQNIGCVD